MLYYVFHCFMHIFGYIRNHEMMMPELVHRQEGIYMYVRQWAMWTNGSYYNVQFQFRNQHHINTVFAENRHSE